MARQHGIDEFELLDRCAVGLAHITKIFGHSVGLFACHKVVEPRLNRRYFGFSQHLIEYDVALFAVLLYFFGAKLVVVATASVAS